MNIGFFVLGKKAYVVLQNFLAHFDSKHLAFVTIARDPNIEYDYYNEIKELCVSNNVKWHDRATFNYANVTSQSTYTFAIGWRWIIPDTKNLIVLHDSILPKYRGFAPLVNMLLNKEPKIGVTALFASQEYDRGDIIDQAVIDIDYPIKITEAIDKISPLYSSLVIHTCQKIIDQQPICGIAQQENDATYSLWRDELDYTIDWRDSAEQISLLINSVSFPYLGASTYIGANKYRIHDAIEVEDKVIVNRKQHVGKCIFKIDNKPVVVCGEGLLLIQSIQDSQDEDVSEKLNFRIRFC